MKMCKRSFLTFSPRCHLFQKIIPRYYYHDLLLLIGPDDRSWCRVSLFNLAFTTTRQGVVLLTHHPAWVDFVADVPGILIAVQCWNCAVIDLTILLLI